MITIKGLTVENTEYCVTDKTNPKFSFYIESDIEGVELKSATFKMGNWVKETKEQIGVIYDGEPLEAFSDYKVTVTAVASNGECDEKSIVFSTGRMGTPFKGQWITMGEYSFTERKTSPKTMTFRRKFGLNKEVKSAKIYSTALGIYELELNKEKVGEDYFAPGFTSYKNQMQYQVYDVTDTLKDSNELIVNVGGGWAVGSFTYKRRNRVYAKRQAFLCEIRVEYTDGSIETIGTDESFEVTLDGNFVYTEFYDGEVYDSTVDLNKVNFVKSTIEKLKFEPNLIATYGNLTQRKEVFEPINQYKADDGTYIYDFGQNFAGVIDAKIKGKKGQKIVFKHAEVLMDGKLFTEPLRTAKQEAVYICNDGEQEYSPKFTYMGFRYVSVEGIEPKDLDLKAVALYSTIDKTGDFSCSNELLNQLQSNLCWGTKSNFVDIPTDCPQRDERMGWTGDIALFSPTASFNFQTARFYEKWLLDVKAEQTFGGGIPVTVPLVRVPNQWEIMIPMAVDHWGDACILVPWAEYQVRGDVNILKEMYPTMKKYIKACEFWANLFSVGEHKYIWRWLHHYGDWVAPNTGLWQWMGRGKWTATACLSNSSNIMSQIAEILNEDEDIKKYKELSEKTASAYKNILMESDCKIKKEFQTGYVLPLHYDMLKGKDREQTAKHLSNLVRKDNFQIGTGFPGTPFVLFALCDNGYVEDAYKMLLSEGCPSWLFQVKAGATTVWERWDALREDGTCNTGADDGTNGMVSFNHFANGAVGNFFYRRIAGIEGTSGGYKTFDIKPVLGGDITFARGEVLTGYGKVVSDWKIEDNLFKIDVEVPCGTTCTLTLPNNEIKTLVSGKYNFEVIL